MSTVRDAIDEARELYFTEFEVDGIVYPYRDRYKQLYVAREMIELIKDHYDTCSICAHAASIDSLIEVGQTAKEDEHHTRERRILMGTKETLDDIVNINSKVNPPNIYWDVADYLNNSTDQQLYELHNSLDNLLKALKREMGKRIINNAKTQ